MNRLFIDIETSPNIGFFWSAGYKINIDYKNIIRERAIICICWKWEHEKTVKFVKWNNGDDKGIIGKIVPVLNNADEIVGHNVNGFDLPWIRTRAAHHGIITNPHYKIIDTLDFAKRRMYLNSNRLDYLAQFFGIGHKIKTDFDLWKNITMKNDKRSLSKMIEYCKMDVLLLEKVYKKLSEHMASHTHCGVNAGSDKWTCSHCGSSNVYVNKTIVTATGALKKNMKCRGCGRYYTISERAYVQYHKLSESDKKNEKKRSES